MLRARFFLLIVGGSLLFLTGLFVFPVPQSSAAIGILPTVVPFGGPIVKIIPCSKPPGLLLTIGPPLPAEVIVVTGRTLIFLFGSFRPGAYALGIADPAPTPCIVGLVPVGAGFIVRFIGTSL